MPKTTITTHPTALQAVILVCRKCSKKLDGGFGPAGKLTLARALKQTLRDAGHRRTVRVIDTKCLGLCPKHAVTILPATAPAAMLTIPAGTDPATLIPLLMPPRPSPEPPPPQTAAPAAGS